MQNNSIDGSNGLQLMVILPYITTLLGETKRLFKSACFALGHKMLASGVPFA